jgi:hypothetical protein
MDNKILEALSQVPELVEATKTANKINQEQSKLLAEIAQRNVHADIPSSEIEKITAEVEEKVKSTACSLPETNELAQQIADRVLNRVDDTIATSVEETVRRTPVTLEHHHTHTTTYALSQYAEESTKKWLLILTLACGLLLSICIGGTYWFLNSEYYLGREYAELCNSKYATESEKDKLWENITVISLLPKDYRKNPERVKTVIRQYKSTLDERKKQAAKNKGTYRNNPAIER